MGNFLYSLLYVIIFIYSVNNIDAEAMEKLQEKFTKTMAEVAELSEEKLRLEHLVLQLQDETETIGNIIFFLCMPLI